MKYLHGLDLTKTELRNAVVHPLDTAPADPIEGQVYYSYATDLIYFWDNVSWVPAPGLLYRGAYSAATQYKLNDTVTYNGSYYAVKLKPSTVGVAPTVTTNWDLLAGGGISTYTNATAMPVAVGGLNSGQTFSSMALTELLDRLLYPYQTPAFSSFTMSGQATSIEVGTTVSGSKTFTWSTSNSSNVTPNSVAITDITRSTTLTSGEANDGSATGTVATLTYSAPATNTWRISATDTSSGHAGLQRDFSVSWYWMKYAGTSTNGTLTAAQIKALTDTAALGTTGLGTYSLSAGGYKYFAMPLSFANPTSIKDVSTGFTVTMADATDDASYNTPVAAVGGSYATVSVTNAQSVTTNYKVFRTRYVLNAAIQIVLA
jgi:hypothetical protein